MKKMTYIFLSVIIAGAMLGSEIYSMHDTPQENEGAVFKKTTLCKPSLMQQTKQKTKQAANWVFNIIPEPIKLGAAASAITYPLMRLSGRGSNKSRASAIVAFGTAVAGQAVTSFFNSHINQGNEEERNNTALQVRIKAKKGDEKIATQLGILASSVTLPFLIKKGLTIKAGAMSLAVGFGTYLATLAWKQFSKKTA